MARRILVLVALALWAIPAATVELARDGQATAVIVTTASATPPEAFAATELANHLQQVTGAAFRQVTEAELPADTPAVFVGHTDFAAAQGIEAAAMGREEWLLQTVGEHLVLTGGRPRGTLYAVYEFLADYLDIVWLSEDVSLIPKQPDLVLPPIDRRGAPAFAFERYVHTDLRQLNHVREYIDKMDLFHTRNRIGSAAWLAGKKRHGVELFGTPGNCHTFYGYLPPDEYFEAHPDWYSLSAAGKRMASTGQLCLTNAEMTAEVCRRLRTFIREDRERARADDRPIPVRYDLSMNDYHNMCQCPECRAVVDREGAESGLVLQFVNRVADDIAEDYPDIAITTFAYSLTLQPPKTVRPSPNVIIKLALLARGAGHDWRDPTRPLTHACHDRHRRAIEGWAAMGARIHVWDYWRLFLGDPFETPYSRVRLIHGDMLFLQQRGVREGHFVEFYGAGQVSFFHLTRWLGIQMMNDPHQDAEALITRFMDAWYGPAAEPVREWMDYLHERLAANPDCITGTPVYRRRYLDIPSFERAYEILDEAARRCPPDSAEQVRVWAERMPVDTALLGLWDKLERERGGGPMPWDRRAILDRYAHHREAVLESILVPSRLPGARGSLAAEVERLRGQMEQPPLPAAFRALPPDDVVDILRLPRWSATHYKRKVIDDPAAPGGIAVCLDTSEMDKHGAEIPVGVYSPDVFGPSLVFAPDTDDAEEPGDFVAGPAADGQSKRIPIPTDEAYHWYRLGPFRIRPGSLLYAHPSWYLQLPGLDRPLMLGLPEDDYYVFFAFKLEGPAYVPGSEKENALLVGRVILVRADSPGIADFVPRPGANQ